MSDSSGPMVMLLLPFFDKVIPQFLPKTVVQHTISDRRFNKAVSCIFPQIICMGCHCTFVVRKGLRSASSPGTQLVIHSVAGHKMVQEGFVNSN